MKILLFCIVLLVFSTCHGDIKKNMSVVEGIKVAYVDSLLPGSSYLADFQILSFSSQNEDALFIGADRLLMADNRMFIVDRLGNKVLAFDEKGNFISSTSRLTGEGPQNYIRMIDATVDNDRKQIYVHCDAPYCIMILDMDLNLIEKISLDFYMHEMVSDGNWLYGICHKENGNQGYELIALDKENLTASPLVLLETNWMIPAVRGMGKSMTAYDNGINVCLPFDHTIYQISDKEIIRSYGIDFGEKGLERTKVENMSERDFFDYIWWIKDIYGSDSNLVFGCNARETFVLDTHTDVCKGYESTYMDMTLYSTTNTFPVQGIGNAFGYVWKSMAIMDFKENASEETLSNLSPEVRTLIQEYDEEDNPLIFLCKMK